jgi:CDP-glucose 4,6-dehydratase
VVHRSRTVENVEMRSAFWKGKKVFLTGHTGFKGGWLSLWLHHLGAEVTGFSLAPPSNPNLFEEANIASCLNSIQGDIRDLDALRNALLHSEAEVVFHLAAQALVRGSYEDPVGTYMTNVQGTVHLLEALRSSSSVRAAVIVTSDKCYENNEWPWGYREDDRLGGFDPYSNSKGCAEMVTAAYRHSFFPTNKYSEHRVAIASARAGNVFGGGDWGKDRLVPDVMRTLLDDSPLNIRNAKSIRPWQHVLEPLSGYLRLAELLSSDGASYSESFNFGPADSDAKTVEWLVNSLLTAWGSGRGWSYDLVQTPHESSYLRLDCSKSKTRLEWAPRLSLVDGLAWTVEWFQGYKRQVNLQELTLEQISRYEDLEPE